MKSVLISLLALSLSSFSYACISDAVLGFSIAGHFLDGTSIVTFDTYKYKSSIDNELQTIEEDPSNTETYTDDDGGLTATILGQLILKALQTGEVANPELYHKFQTAVRFLSLRVHEFGFEEDSITSIKTASNYFLENSAPTSNDVYDEFLGHLNSLPKSKLGYSLADKSRDDSIDLASIDLLSTPRSPDSCSSAMLSLVTVN